MDFFWKTFRKKIKNIYFRLKKVFNKKSEKVKKIVNFTIRWKMEK